MPSRVDRLSRTAQVAAPLSDVHMIRVGFAIGAFVLGSHQHVSTVWMSAELTRRRGASSSTKQSCALMLCLCRCSSFLQ